MEILIKNEDEKRGGEKRTWVSKTKLRLRFHAANEEVENRGLWGKGEKNNNNKII